VKFKILAVLIISLSLKGAIEFPTSPSYSIFEEKNHYSIKIGDINGDGFQDLILSGYGEKLEVYLNSNSGISQNPSYSSNENQSSFELLLEDIDKNGYLDVIVVNYSDPVRIYLNNSGTLSNIANWESKDLSNTTTCATLNISNGAYKDLVCGGYYEPIKIYKNNNGNLPEFKSWQSQEEDLAIVSIKAADIDKDGWQDIVLASDGGPLRVYKNNGGSFSSFIWQSSISLDAQNLNLCDLNSDGFLDLIVSQWNNSILVFKNINGTIEDYPSYFSFYSGFYESSSCGDFDGDGFSEFFSTNDSYKVEGYENENGNISYLPIYETAEDSHQWGITTSDLNNDGKLDFCVAKRFQKSSCFLNNGNFQENPPTSPDLNVNVLGQNVTFAFSNSIDDNTPQSAISYFLRIGTSSGGREVLYAPLGTTDFTAIYGDFFSNILELNLPDGNYYASSQSVDLAFLRSQWGNEVNFIVDITKPSSIFTYPLNGDNITTCGTINVKGTASDNVSGVLKVEFSYDGTNYFLADGTENWSYNWNVPSSGNYNLYSKATDKKENIENPPNSINVQITIDNVPPENVANTLRAIKISSNNVNLNWEDKSQSGAVSYNIYKGITADFMLSNPPPYANSSTNSYTDYSANEEKIFYKVKAVDLCGNESED